MSKYLFVIILFFLSSCDWGMPESQLEYIESLEPTKPTLKEDSYIIELEKRGFSNVRFEIPEIGRNILGESDYRIRLKCPFNLTENNQDSIIKISNQIMKELYSSVIEDSIIIDCKVFHVDFTVEKSEIKNDMNILSQEYKKSSLEKLNGFKVVKIREGIFKRKNVK